MNKPLSLEQFIEASIHDEMITNQIESLKKTIAKAQNQIVLLEASREEQNQLPWYKRSGLVFVHSKFNHFDGYRSDFDGSDTYGKYEAFIAIMLRQHLDMHRICDDSDFTICTPTNEIYKLRDIDFASLPLYAEYRKRVDLLKQQEAMQKELDSLDEDIAGLTAKSQEADNYTEERRKFFLNKAEEAAKEKEELLTGWNESEVAKQISAYNVLLQGVDRIFADEEDE